MGSRSRRSGDTQGETGPWEGQAPFLGDVFNRAQNWLNTGGGKQSRQINRNLRNRAQGVLQRGGSDVEQAFRGTLLDFLNPGATENPYLDQTFGRASDAVTERFNEAVLPGLNATFSSAGRTGGGLHQQALTGAAGELGDTLGGLATDIYGGAYEGDRNRAIQAGGLVPSYEGLQDQNVADYQYFADQKLRNLSAYSNIIQNNPYTQGFQTGTSRGSAKSLDNPLSFSF